jgi:hypothetical protein
LEPTSIAASRMTKGNLRGGRSHSSIDRVNQQRTLDRQPVVKC